ncbi:DMT family transporter [Schinkia azotoformans]|uniref:EamA domain-containing protein n=1 Tax=Schinkia azotoformans LMG 9581 TaxID=1131731 RepID=K6BWE0_SCHAZ|nr:DMT family transporter [Schinkia azotoformans]EKN63255.1 hypothetical protein BAZO_18421 [Schinkia azotoformans LMG 9581]MEC1637195.1 DMT family transporter [Schinkia azotoformans]MEC1720643.1 DMT family transporter [Schinkia azotoformans]MEC1943599.1 DMT family transporter [Schinkia azotoformans]MED4411782.1 DMT family transporter [Schinkia azotoformans]
MEDIEVPKHESWEYMRKQLLYVQLLFVMMVWGFNVIAIKIIVEQFFAVTITSLRIFLAAIVVWLLLRIQKKIRLPQKREILFILVAMFVGIVGHHYFLSVGLTGTTAANAGLIFGIVPLLTSILAALMLKERLTFIRIIGIIIGIIGVSIIVLAGNQGIHLSYGDIYIFIAVIFQAISFIYIKKATETMDAVLTTAYMLIMGSFFLFVISFIIEPEGLSSLKNGTVLGWSVFLGSAIIATALGQILYNHAIQYIGAGKTAVFLNIPPFFSLVGSYLFLGELISLSHIFGFILIVGSVILGSGLADYYIYKRTHPMITGKG